MFKTRALTFSADSYAITNAPGVQLFESGVKVSARESREPVEPGAVALSESGPWPSDEDGRFSLVPTGERRSVSIGGLPTNQPSARQRPSSSPNQRGYSGAICRF